MSQWKPNKSIIFQRSNVLKSELDIRTDISWEAALGEPAECISVESNDPLYILYTSGTTGNNFLIYLQINSNQQFIYKKTNQRVFRDQLEVI